MHTWFECKVKYERAAEQGTMTKVNESYLVDALSFTEAEARIVEEIQPFISGDFTVANIKRARISEMFLNENGDKWFRSKVVFVTFDEESGKEKNTPVQMMIQAESIQNALDTLVQGMKGTMADYRIASITETNLIDVFKYSSEEKES